MDAHLISYTFIRKLTKQSGVLTLEKGCNKVKS